MIGQVVTLRLCVQMTCLEPARAAHKTPHLPAAPYAASEFVVGRTPARARPGGTELWAAISALLLSAEMGLSPQKFQLGRRLSSVTMAISLTVMAVTADVSWSHRQRAWYVQHARIRASC